MMAPPTYTEALLRAKYHVQVEIEGREVVDKTPAHASVRCRVHHVFRGDDLHVGDSVRFPVSVCREDDEIPAGGVSWSLLGAFQKARYLEAFLDGNPPDCVVACSHTYFIGELSGKPKIAVPTEDEVAAEWLDFNTRRSLGTWLLAQGRPLRWLLKLVRSRHYHPADS